jgi:proteic killer suppression protein
MIRSFKHEGLEKFFVSGSKAGIQPAHAQKLSILLTALHAAKRIENMDVPSWVLHALKGDLTGHWSVRVNGNWRMTFRLDEGDAEVVDYQDYH